MAIQPLFNGRDTEICLEWRPGGTPMWCLGQTQAAGSSPRGCWAHPGPWFPLLEFTRPSSETERNKRRVAVPSRGPLTSLPGLPGAGTGGRALLRMASPHVLLPPVGTVARGPLDLWLLLSPPRSTATAEHSPPRCAHSSLVCPQSTGHLPGRFRWLTATAWPGPWPLVQRDHPFHTPG